MTETRTAAAGWSDALGANPEPVRASRRHVRCTDEQLARAAGRGDVRAFEALYERHHRPLLSFARHMLGRSHDAEDVVQHTFVAADRAFCAGKVPNAVRAWLYTVARNRCVSLLRARRDEQALHDAAVPTTENLAHEVEQRDDLRALLADVRALPDDQRAALLLAELGDLSHAEVAAVIGVRPGKVRALVFQARETLMAFAHARAIPCQSIREELAVATGAGLRRRHLRNHLAQCPDCSDYAARVRAQRASLAAILPVVPTVALRDGVLAALGGGGAAAVGAGATAGFGGLAAKLLTVAAVGGAAAGGGAVAVTSTDAPSRERSRQQTVERAPTVTPPARERPAAPAPDAAAPVSQRAAERAPARERGRGAGTPRPARERTPAPVAAPAPARRDDAAPAAPPRADPPGQARQQAGGEPPGQLRRAGGPPPGQARSNAPAGPPGQAAKPAVPPVKPAVPPGQAQQAPPGAAAPAGDVPPGQARKDAQG